MPFVTRYSFNVSLQRDFRWGDKPGYAMLYYSEISPVEMRLSRYPVISSDVIRFLNVNTSLHWSEALSFGVFARNLLNDRGYLDPFWVYGQGSRAQPRTFGINFSVRLGRN